MLERGLTGMLCLNLNQSTIFLILNPYPTKLFHLKNFNQENVGLREAQIDFVAKEINLDFLYIFQENFHSIHEKPKSFQN